MRDAVSHRPPALNAIALHESQIDQIFELSAARAEELLDCNRDIEMDCAHTATADCATTSCATGNQIPVLQRLSHVHLCRGSTSCSQFRLHATGEISLPRQPASSRTLLHHSPALLKLLAIAPACGLVNTDRL